MRIDLGGKQALVTGGSGAIGRAICVRLAEAGADVALTYFSDREGAAAAASQVRALGRSATVLRVNFADRIDTERLLGELAELLAGVDLLVSNAASGVVKPTDQLTSKHWQWSMDVNAHALFRLVQVMVAPRGPDHAPLLRDGGRILALSSLGAGRAIPQYAAVGASKAAVEALIRSMCVDLGPRGITANVVSPGLVLTRALDHFPNREQLVEVATRKTPVPRLTTPDDVADVVCFLCSEHAAMISGQTLHVDGGYSAVA